MKRNRSTNRPAASRLASVSTLSLLLLAVALFDGAHRLHAAAYPLPAEMRRTTNLGIFVGVNTFKARGSRFGNLKNAVNDAIEYAHVFTVDLRLIEPTNCYLAIAGEPSTAEIKRDLEQLKASGANVRTASVDGVLECVNQVKRRATDNHGMLVLTMATHGYRTSSSSDIYALLSDSRGDEAGLVDHVDFTKLFDSLENADFSKRLFVLDLCRKVEGERSSGAGVEMEKYLEAFRAASGTIIVSACKDGEASQEHPTKPHGAFSLYFIEGLREGAPMDPVYEYVTVGNAYNYAKKRLDEDKEIERLGLKQSPVVYGDVSLPVRGTRELASFQSQIARARQVLLTNVNPAASTPLTGTRMDELWEALDRAPISSRRALAGKIIEQLGTGNEAQRKDFFTWWAGALAQSPGLQAAASAPLKTGKQAVSPPELVLRGSVPDTITNTLGMVFRRASFANGVWCSIWETRVQDFRQFLRSRKTFDRWSNAVPTAAVNSVTWNEASEFCDWLTRAESNLLPKRHYRLPTDREWSQAAGLEEKPGITPASLDLGAPGYPWGNAWPPPARAGNFAGEERENDPLRLAHYNDGSPGVASVGSFSPNANGLYDMSGNVWEWVADDYDRNSGAKVLRGGAYAFQAGTRPETQLRTSYRFSAQPGARTGTIGFRILLESP